MRGPPASWLAAATCWSRAPSASIGTGLSSTKTAPVRSIEIATGSRFCSSAAALLCGRSTWTPVASKGAVTMKMIRSTSITSTIGVTLISAIGLLRPRWPPLWRGPIAISGFDLQLPRQRPVEAVGEALEAGLDAVDAVAEAVVGDHRRNRREQAQSGREQSLVDARRDHRQRGILGAGDV